MEKLAIFYLEKKFFMRNLILKQGLRDIIISHGSRLKVSFIREPLLFKASSPNKMAIITLFKYF